MSPKLKNAIKDSGGVAIIFTIIQFINPYLFPVLRSYQYG